MCLALLSAAHIHGQVLTESGSGFHTPEGILVSNVDQYSPAPFYNLSFLSAQDVYGDGKLDLLVGMPSLANGFPVTTTVLRNQGRQKFELVAADAKDYCQPVYFNPPSANWVMPFCTLANLYGSERPDRIFAMETPNGANAAEVDNPEIVVSHAPGRDLVSRIERYSVGGRGSYISSVATGDFNGDGLTDIAVLRMPQNADPKTGLLIADIILLIADGRGGFTVSKPVSSGVFRSGSPSYYPQLAALDLNGDGKSDLIVYGGSGGSAVGVFFGTSTGLSQRPSLPFQNTPFQVQVAADLNHDGYGDIVAVEADGVHILMGGPQGSHYGYFSSDQLLAPSDVFNQIEMVAAADFNGDGLPDLAVATQNDVTIFEQQRDGHFYRLQQYASSGLIAVGDFDGDGNIDLALGGNPINILYGDGTGHFHGPPITANHGMPAGVATGDFNHDGIPDIATTWIGNCAGSDCTNVYVSIFMGTDKGLFLPPMSYQVPLFTDQLGSVVVAVGDLNGDGNPDVVAVNSFPGGTFDTAVLLGKRDGTFSAARGYSLGTAKNGIVYLRDMDRDGNLDLIGNNAIAYGKGDGSFGEVISLPNGPVDGLAVGDFNHDGRQDLLTDQGGEITSFLGAAGRAFTRRQSVALPCKNSCVFGSTLAMGDLNNDGRLDFAALANGELFTYMGNGNGTFRLAADAAVSTLYPYSFPNLPISIEDINGDGRKDVILAPDEGIMPVYLGRGNGTLSAPIVFAVNAGFLGISGFPVFGHFHSGPELDMITPAGSGFTRLINSGNGTWPKAKLMPLAPQP
jgi:hypothetical protein